MLKKHLSLDEVTRLRSFLKGSETEAILFGLLLETGCRTDELCRIQVKDLNSEANTVTIFRGAKGSESRTAPLSPELIKLALKATAKRGLLGTSRLIELLTDATSIGAQKRALQRHWQRYRLMVFGTNFDLGLHAFRHTKATTVHKKASVKGNCDPLLVTQLCLGHKSLRSTLYYLKYIQYADFSDLFKDEK